MNQKSPQELRIDDGSARNRLLHRGECAGSACSEAEAVTEATGRRFQAPPTCFGFGILLALLAGTAVPAFAQDSFSNPAGSGVIVSAVAWLQGTLLGTMATIVAVIAVATVGLMLLSGRINWRHGATVILGCFILFGASTIVGGIQSTAALGQ